MSDDPFSPPAERNAPAGTSTTVMMVWMVCGALVGITGALTAQLTGTSQAIATLSGLGPIGLFGVLGFLAYQVDRILAADRPGLLDAHGRRHTPVHAWVYLLPLVVCVPAILWLVMVVTVAMTSLLMGLMFATGGFALGWAVRKIVARQALSEALQLLELGEIEQAERRLERIANGFWSTRASKHTAHLNLGLVALTLGDLDDAAEHYGNVGDGVGGTFARAGLALVYALQDRSAACENALLDAMSGPGATAVQSQTDAVRLLLTLRSDGAEAARELGDNLLNVDAGDLFRGILAYAYVLTGDEAGAKRLAGPEIRESLDASWRSVVPEIAELAVAIG